MLTPLVSESAELTQWSLKLIHYSELATEREGKKGVLLADGGGGGGGGLEPIPTKARKGFLCITGKWLNI